MPKYMVKVWKTETWETTIEVEAASEADAAFEAEETVQHEEVNWFYVDCLIEVDGIKEVEDEEA